METVTVIINPAAGGGKARTMLAAIEAAFAPLGARLLFTRHPRQEEQLAYDAARTGSATIVAVGGDGTWGNVAHGVISSGATPRVALLAAGTGNDFAKSVAAPAHDPAVTARLIRSGAERRVDVGVAGDRIFLNCCGFGFDAAVLERSDRMRVVRGAVRYLAAAVAEIFSYRSEVVRITPWNPTTTEPDTLLTVFANGAWYGGMFHIAPHARPDDGRLEAVRIRDVRGLSRLALLRDAIRGRHLRRRGVELASGSSFTLRFDAPPMINVDGELRQASSSELKIAVLPGALRLVASPPVD